MCLFPCWTRLLIVGLHCGHNIHLFCHVRSFLLSFFSANDMETIKMDFMAVSTSFTSFFSTSWVAKLGKWCERSPCWFYLGIGCQSWVHKCGVAYICTIWMGELILEYLWMTIFTIPIHRMLNNGSISVDIFFVGCPWIPQCSGCLPLYCKVQKLSLHLFQVRILSRLNLGVFQKSEILSGFGPFL